MFFTFIIGLVGYPLAGILALLFLLGFVGAGRIWHDVADEFDYRATVTCIFICGPLAMLVAWATRNML
ncbi:hypothetical protein [Methylobacterium ajmalii]|uniref:hypothetical protein n=1 Tax=Methylobacterium ajmalii TaxID=2738439 RepID=UPI002F3602CE